MIPGAGGNVRGFLRLKGHGGDAGAGTPGQVTVIVSRPHAKAGARPVKGGAGTQYQIDVLRRDGAGAVRDRLPEAQTALSPGLRTIRNQGGHLCAADAPGVGKPLALVPDGPERSEEHTSELQSRFDLVCRLLLVKEKNNTM